LTTAIIIVAILVFLYFFISKKKEEDKTIDVAKDKIKNEKPVEFSDVEIIDQDEIYIDEKGLQYKIVEKTRELPRHTYIKAFLNGKYWGEIDEIFSNQFEHSKFFDFNIYEVTLKNAVYSHSPFQLEKDLKIPREKLPKLLHTILEKDGKEYEVNLHEPFFSEIKFNRKLHQDEGNEVFGTIDAIVTGYVLDFVIEDYTEKVYLIPIAENPSQTPIITQPVLTKTLTPTGNVEYKGNYKRTEYFYSDFRNTYWDNWKYTKPVNTSNNEGCFSTIIGAIGVILGIAFLLIMLPKMAFILPFFLILFLLNLIPAKIYSWIFRIIGLLMLIGFIVSLLQIFNRSAIAYIPKPIVVENPQERETQSTPITENENNIKIRDTLIKHYRIWDDYEGKKYEGYIWTKKSDYLNAKHYKNSLNLKQNTPRAYDEIIYSLKEYDKQNLDGVYQLFDSISKKEQLSKVKFAELLVSFIQDIPYAVIVPDDCNPNLYDDKFIREYLSSKNGSCNGFQKFGINSPVEFMSNLYGDCDTRTLLLYTMLSNYGYDVALFSSEYYSHSIIGINLPIAGISYKYGNQRYVLWETTAPNIKAGVLPKEISNLNYWRISLKSK
jgi:PKD repeat protein